MTSLTPPMIIGALAVLTTGVAVGLVGSGLWTIITGRSIVWEISPRLRVAQIIWLVVYARVQGKNIVQVGLKLFVHHVSTGRKILGRRRPQYTRAYGIGREILINMLPVQERPASPRANGPRPVFNLRHDLFPLVQASTRVIRTVRR